LVELKSKCDIFELNWRSWWYLWN